jgi:predicted dehydrogenase
MDEIGVGIVGAGVRGVYCLGQAIVALEGSSELVVSGVHDIVEPRAHEGAEYLNRLYAESGSVRRARVYETFRDMLDDDSCRIILITNFTNQHRPYAVAALEAGKKVYLDKPIAVTRDDATEIVRSARGNPLIMGFTRRYERSWIKAKELVDSGAIGPLQMMEISSIIPYSRYLQTWHRRRELSGGSINDKCSHHFDVFNWMAG